MSQLTLTIDFSRPMPVFPLTGCVLLPHVAAPLHIFEPRYRRMASDALDSLGLIAMAVFADDVAEDEYLTGRPELRPMTCVGYVAQYDRLDDGRYLLLLQGVCRAKLIEEVEHEPYRMARLDPVGLTQPSDDDLADARARIDALLGDPAMAELESVSELRRLIDDDIPTEPLIELTVARMYGDAESMYRILAEPDPTARAEYLIGRLERTRDNAERE